MQKSIKNYMHTDRIAKRTAAKKLHGKWLQEVWRLEDLLEEAKRRELDSFAAADVARKSDANRRNNLAQLASGRVEVIDILESDALESPWWRRADRRQDTLAQIAAGATVFELDK